MVDVECALFIDGRWAAPVRKERIVVVEAATGEPLGTVAAADGEDVDAAVSAARAARDSWAARSAADRAALVAGFAKALQAQGRETARLVSSENGMPLSLSKGANGFAPAQILQYYADLVDGRITEQERPGAAGTTFVRREPVGVVAAIVPWNYPQALAAMKLGPALAAGCTLVLKSAPETGLDAAAFAEAARQAGLPPGVLNIVSGGRETGAVLVEHPDVDKVAFTGSTAAGRAIAEACGRALRPVTLELGGKSAAIIAEDADLELFTARLPEVCLANNGQTCHASTRILAPRSRYDEIVDAVTATVRGLTIGDPLDKRTDIGPLVSAAQRDRVLGYIDAARREGIRMTTGGSAPAGLEHGWFVEPTVFVDVPPSATIAQEEIFGPVLCVSSYDTVDDAVRLANDSSYGLAGTVWTRDEDYGRAIARRVHTGTIGVNTYALDVNAPFGGVKSSGLGYEMGPEGLEPYYRLKSIYTNAP